LCTLEDSVSRKALEIYIVRLRKKIENSGAQIVTLRGLGYTLTGDRRVINSGSEKFREVVMGCGAYT
jgi:DNA-binding winged helix-turn-helix (wHTH) protein